MRLCGRVETDNEGSFYVFSLAYFMSQLNGSALFASDGKAASSEAYDLARDLTGFWAHDGAPGQWFWCAAHVRLSRTRVLVTQRGAYDI